MTSKSAMLPIENGGKFAKTSTLKVTVEGVEYESSKVHTII